MLYFLLADGAGAYKMELSAEKSKIMVNSTSDVSASITMNGEPLKEIVQFKHLGAILSRDGSFTVEIDFGSYLTLTCFNDAIRTT